MWITKCVENPQSLLTLFTSRRVEVGSNLTVLGQKLF